MLDTILETDSTLLSLINQYWRNEQLDSVMRTLSTDPLFWVIMGGLGILLLCLKLKRAIWRLWLPLLAISLSVGAADLTTNAVKHVVERPRPKNSLPFVFFESKGVWRQNPADFKPKKSHSYSFYSSHAANSMAIATTVASIVPQSAPLVYLLSFSVGYSRVYMGKHYPSDVLVGWLAGWLIGKAIGLLYHRARRRLELRGQQFPAILSGSGNLPEPAELIPSTPTATPLPSWHNLRVKYFRLRRPFRATRL